MKYRIKVWCEDCLGNPHGCFMGGWEWVDWHWAGIRKEEKEQYEPAEFATKEEAEKVVDYLESYEADLPPCWRYEIVVYNAI